MSKLLHAVRDRRARRAEYRRSIHYAIRHAISENDRNELITMATAQGVEL
jgi:hypothetical protein